MIKKKKTLRKKTKELEFMQKILIALIILSIIFTTLSYVLSFFDKNPVEQLSIEIIRMLWSADGAGIIAYAWQNCMRAKWFGDKTAHLNINKTEGDI